MALTDNSYTERYLEQNILFAKTVVVKLAEAAELMNEGVVAKFGREAVDTINPRTWKYYLNLSGAYHFSDAPMSVVSIDTLESISFTKENLAIHTATAGAYAYGSRHYFTLLDKYPDQELLINGILTPADIDVAIAADSGTILAYPTHLVEPHEATLIADLEAWLKRQIHRWYNVQFAMSDNLFCAVFLTTLSNFILPKLLNLRLARCKTAEAHSYHVRMYLASHGGLDRYLPYLTLDQALWLYRNVAYLERNVGQSRQFVTLIHKLLTRRGIPLSDYTVRHSDEFVGYLPTALAHLRPLNDQTNQYTITSRPLQELFDLERPLVEDNDVYFDTHAVRDELQFQTADSGVIQTKVLSSTMVDYTNAVPEPFEVVAMRQWCYMATHGLYDVMVTFKDPRNSEPYTVFAKDAFIYLWYIQLSREGLTLVQFPEYLNMQQRRHPKPTVADLLSVTDTTQYDLTAVATYLVQNQPNITPCFSVSSFNAQVQRLTDEAYKHWFIIAAQNDPYARAMVENMILRLYEDERVVFDMEVPTIEEWLTLNDLPAFDHSPEQSLALIKAIYEAGTGQVIDSTKILKNIQKAMLDLMMELSSYSLQMIRKISDEDLISLNWPAVRTSNPDVRQSDYRNVDVSTLVLAGTTQSAETADVGTTVDTHLRPNPCPTCFAQEAFLDVGSVTLSSGRFEMVVEDIGPPPQCDITYPGQNYGLEQSMMLPGYTTFHQLPESAQAQLKSKYL